MPTTSVESGPLIALPDWTVVRVDGADAQDFLHRQFTADIVGLRPQAITLAGYCAPNGRLLATLFVCWRDDALHLVLPRSTCSALVQRLRMFVLRDDVQITPLELPVAAAIGRTRPAAGTCELREGITWLGLPGDHPRAIAIGLDVATTDADAWAAAEIDAGQASVTAATTDQFLPQSLRLDQLGGVSFRKGCYPGQEIVARLHYRGTLKRVLTRAGITAGHCTAGDAVERDGQSIGTIAVASDTAALAVLRVDALGGPAKAGSAELMLESEAVSVA
ncbi:hypothetical protein [uncultured Abyssibacter sp.]|uniref:CAF17-like 4Fe-4S cluster assembly/insertion protein YgfZ n=1 Tax=uncultured Abyssibacter sp. TaxID=2320202 RepID=UPI0032B1C92D